MVTAGANQAMFSLMLTLLNPKDKAVIFKPYYFNALMVSLPKILKFYFINKILIKYFAESLGPSPETQSNDCSVKE